MDEVVDLVDKDKTFHAPLLVHLNQLCPKMQPQCSKVS